MRVLQVSRAAIDLGRARAALARFAIPADGQVRRLVRLDMVERIQHDHSRSHGHTVGDRLPAFAVSPEDLKDCFRHRASLFIFHRDPGSAAIPARCRATKCVISLP
ncbi:MAG TPA: hypothetical protein VN868_02345 [Terriglobales bacterium]|nr:hypothetical protein [Terriglobales bacterium]